MQRPVMGSQQPPHRVPCREWKCSEQRRRPSASMAEPGSAVCAEEVVRVPGLVQSCQDVLTQHVLQDVVQLFRGRVRSQGSCHRSRKITKTQRA
ncbi:hypothetical protein EYF80_029033 [Liparis tanakae]|uniref:Uncharacterized protein n=1 Tax=Liparis tanakae TaxID=230148 RepID=A0A4Z2H4K2_9TELE|nr:hypothetical protein EYF80_029033 [Liparis tanakae]